MMKKTALLLFATVIIIFSTVLAGCQGATQQQGTIKIGVLHALSGAMAISEKSVVDAVELAVEEINANGGVLGQEVEIVIADTETNWDLAASEAKRLITEEEVSAVFGCWTSSCRRTVRPVFEEYNSLLFYPVQYEGLELSPNIIYTGAAPNQQITPAVKWSFDNLGTRFFLVGSDYVFPRTANELIKVQVDALGGEILGEEYILLDSNDVNVMVAKIIQTQPDVILNTINGESNVAFFQALQEAGITANDIPVVSFSIAEDELRTLGATRMAGNYASWNYFQSIDSERNTAFVEAFKNKFGSERVTDDPMEAAYFGVYLWAQAVEEAGVSDPASVRQTIANQSFLAPEGVVTIDGETLHTWKAVHIGKILQNGQFEIVWTSNGPVRPLSYPIYRSQAEWDQFLVELYSGWGNSWANPGN